MHGPHAAKPSAWLIQRYWWALQTLHEDSLPPRNQSNQHNGKAPTPGPHQSPCDVSPASWSFSHCVCFLRHAASGHERQQRDPRCIAFMETTVIRHRWQECDCNLLAYGSRSSSSLPLVVFNTLAEAAIVGFCRGLRSPS